MRIHILPNIFCSLSPTYEQNNVRAESVAMVATIHITLYA
jgi:hypothetical protein